MGLCRQADNALGAINPMRWEGHRLAGEPVFRLRCPPTPCCAARVLPLPPGGGKQVVTCNRRFACGS